MGFKRTKFAVASLLLASLTACSTNKADVNNNPVGPRDVSTGDLDRVNNRHFMTKDVDRVNNRILTTDDFGRRNNRNANRLNTGNMANSTTEIQSMNNGFIPIANNSYSTDTPSHKFPHTKRVQQGNFWYYTFVPDQRGTNIPQQPGNGVTPPAPTAPNPAAPAAPPNPAAPTAPTAPSQQPTTQAPVGISQMAQQVIDLTNNERKKNGLPSLKADGSLSKVAQTKSNDMETKHYFSHTSPTYGSPFDMMRDFGVTYKSAGENIAMGQPTAQAVVNAWMNSEGHRKNILSANYTNIGVGFTSKGNYWSQMFIGK
jgi:uncharacterized YkwD family protein